MQDFSAGESDDESDGLLKKRVKTVEEQKAEDDEYFEWLKGQKDLQNVDNDLVGFHLISIFIYKSLEKFEEKLGWTKY